MAGTKFGRHNRLLQYQVLHLVVNCTSSHVLFSWATLTKLARNSREKARKLVGSGQIAMMRPSQAKETTSNDMTEKQQSTVVELEDPKMLHPARSPGGQPFHRERGAGLSMKSCEGQGKRMLPAQRPFLGSPASLVEGLRRAYGGRVKVIRRIPL